MSDIIIKGAREHNLCDVDLRLPRNRLICFTGVSGSGKSSLAFDTLYAEGQRRYIESLSSFARQFLGQLPKPDVDHLSGLSPSISISQKTGGQSPRSTVGTITEIYDFLRVLFARVATPYCPRCGRPITAQTRQQIIDRIETLPEGERFLVLAPVVRGQKGEHRDLFASLLKQGFNRARVDGNIVRLADDLRLDRQMRHDIDVVVDRLVQSGPAGRSRLAEAVERALLLGGGQLELRIESGELRVQEEGTGNRKQGAEQKKKAAKKLSTLHSPLSTAEKDLSFSAHYACTACNINFEPPTPQMFSFNSPQGMCPKCDGLGSIHGFDPALLIPDPTLSFQQGCVKPIGKWREMGRWKRHIFTGVAETLERIHHLPAHTVLETAWEELPGKIQHALLWGTGDQHITFTWRNGPSGHKWGGKFDGIIPQMLQQYRDTKSRMQIMAMDKYMNVIPCGFCKGERLNEQARSFELETASDSPKFAKKRSLSLPRLCALPITDLREFFSELRLSESGRTIALEALKEIRNRLGFLVNVGLDYLSLDRTAPTLSGGEMQRIRLASQIGSGLVGVLYVLDEPSIGLHPRDNDRLLATLKHLRDQGNTVLVVEHDEDTMRAADLIVDFGPGPGVHGGEIVALGTPEEIQGERGEGRGEKGEGRRERGKRSQTEFENRKEKSGPQNNESGIQNIPAPLSLTAKFLTGAEKIEVPVVRRPVDPDRMLRICGATHNNLKGIDVGIPLGTFTCITGVSGSGKSSLVNDILVEALNRDLNGGLGNPGAHERIDGIDRLDKLIAIDQSPIGRTPRSNPATYIKLFDEIRKLYSEMPEARAKGYGPGRFSFNIPGGRCEACEGHGATKLEMDFLADIWVTCTACQGRRFNHETLSIRFKGKSIDQVLGMDVEEALRHFEHIPKIKQKLRTLRDVGLGYMKLGQPSPTLSGGEAQRIKLARELVKRSTGKTLYLLDEPTTGLHFADVRMLLKVLHDFADAGNTVLVVEHHLDVIKTADWIIDLGPEGGEAGGHIVAEGTPEQIAEMKTSYTGLALKKTLNPARKPIAHASHSASKTPPHSFTRSLAHSLTVKHAEQHNLKSVSVDIPRDRLTVCCGPSGSGKTSLAMDTIYAEGQRRYVESLSSYARQFVGQMQKPRVERIDGLSPAIAIEQKAASHSPRSTVGTVTEIHDYLRVLFARLGTPYCPHCDIPIGTQTLDEIIAKVWQHDPDVRLLIASPLNVEVGQSYEDLWNRLRNQGFVRVRIDGTIHQLDDPLPDIDRRRKHAVELVVDRVILSDAGVRARLADSIEIALEFGAGIVHVIEVDKDKPQEQWKTVRHSRHLSCDRCGRSFEPLSPHHFSFNSPLGWCPHCEGLGVRTGANPAMFLHDPKRTLAQGAVALWPGVRGTLSAKMLAVFSEATGVPTDVPFEQLDARFRRTIFHGTGETWFEVPPAANGERNTPGFKFQYKGLYPALEEAGRLVVSFRSQFEYYADQVECGACLGSRLREDAAAVRFIGHTMDQICRLPLAPLLELFNRWEPNETEKKIAADLLEEVRNRLRFLTEVGLDYLTLSRPAPTLSGGEAQRIRLAAQIGSGLVGVLYVLDEPTIGLHPRDNTRLIGALKKLRDLGNTLLLVEHDREVIAEADALIDFGPHAGKFGGEIVASGPPRSVAKDKNSVTGPYLSGKKAIPVPTNRRRGERGEGRGENASNPNLKIAKKKAAPKTTRAESKTSPLPSPLSPLPSLTVRGARQNNLKSIDVSFPLGALTVVTGVSGSGKSSLVEDVLYKELARTLHRAQVTPGAHDGIEGISQINKVIRVDQQPLGQTPTSNPATYTGVFELIRDLFAQLPESKLRGYTARRFSFNVPGGRCEKCEGNGQIKIEMHFLPDVWITCDSCGGKRYDRQTLEVKYRGQSIADVLEMSCEEALRLFANIPNIRRILQTLCDVGLGYLSLGQAAPTLSGGEAQRVKLAAELSRPDTGRTLYLLDEPTTGLHFEDLEKLLDVLNRLVDLGNTVIVIEHNLDIIKSADWIIDLGPEAGLDGGHLVFAGTPEELVQRGKRERGEGRGKKVAKQSAKKAVGKTADVEENGFVSHTAEALAPVLAAGPFGERKKYDPKTLDVPREGDVDIDEVGAEARMPWELDGPRWHTKDRVGRTGNPCRWDGRILAEVVEKIQEYDCFAETDWNSRTIVEIRGEKKSLGWFFHAITGEEWLLKMKFRTAKNTFNRSALIERLDLKPLNDMPDIPLYGTEPRVRVQSGPGPWQEVELKVHSHAEIDRREFRDFLELAIEGFEKFSDKKKENPSELMPWKILKEKWHFLPKGLVGGTRLEWDYSVLKEVFGLLDSVAPDARIVWTNKVLVPYHLGSNERTGGRVLPWAVVNTKRVDAVLLELFVSKNAVPLGRILNLGVNPEVDGGNPGYDVVKLSFARKSDVNKTALRALLEETKNMGIR